NHLRRGADDEMVAEAQANGLFGKDWASSLMSDTEHGGGELGDVARRLLEQPEIPEAEESIHAIMRLKEWYINSAAAVADAPTKQATGKALAKAAFAPAKGAGKLLTRPL